MSFQCIAIAKRLEEFRILEEYRVTKRRIPFLIFVNNANDYRILLFTSNKEWLNCKMWMADYTFDQIPTLFEKFYTIKAMIDRTAVPAVFALLPHNKKIYVLDNSRNAYKT